MRVKGGVVTHRKHKKIRNSTKGYRKTYRTTYKRAHEAYLHAGQYSYIHRRKRLHQFRRLWIVRLSAAVKKFNLNYSTFINNLKQANIVLNRKMLSELAINHPDAFRAVVEQSKK